MRVGSVFIPVRDLDRAAAWYQQNLQVNIIDRWEGGIGFYFPEGPTQFALIQVEGDPSTEFPMNKERKNVWFLHVLTLPFLSPHLLTSLAPH